MRRFIPLAALPLVFAAACGGGGTTGDGRADVSPPTPPTPPTAPTTQTTTDTTTEPAFAPADCDPERIEQDLEIPAEQAAFAATVDYCEPPGWAVIRWDSPGDSQRIARLVGTTWTTYVSFPHDVCRTQARTEDVPEALDEYFLPC